MKTPTHPGTLLAERFLAPMSVSVGQLAQAISIGERALEGVLRGEAPIDAELAIRLGLFFDCPAIWWLEMQARFDTESTHEVRRLQKVVKPFSKLADFFITPSGARPLALRAESKPDVELVPVSSKLLERLRAQARLSRPREAREVQVVTFDNGAQALVGKTE